MYIFHLVKGQDNFNSRSKMAHLPLQIDRLMVLLVYCYHGVQGVQGGDIYSPKWNEACLKTLVYPTLSQLILHILPHLRV